MSDSDYDVVIVGAGIAAAMCARQLSNKGKKVLILEAGKPFGARQESIDRYYSGNAYPFPGNTAAPYPKYPNGGPSKPWKDPKDGYWTQSGDYAFGSLYDRYKGGTTNHWLGTALREFPDDLKLKSKLKCESPYARDWPIEYTTLEKKYYPLADKVIGVSGDKAVDKELGIPRDEDYPMPVLPLSYSDQQVANGMDGDPGVDGQEVETPGPAPSVKLKVVTTPQARNSTFYDKRPRCMGNSSCVPICPIQAKFDGSVLLKKITAPLSPEEKNSGSSRVPVTLRTQSVVHKVDVGADDKVAGIKYYVYSLDGAGQLLTKTEKTITAKIYVLAAHAVETPKILLNSPWTPASGPKKGEAITVANSSDQVGRNLMDHICLVYWGKAKEPVFQYRGPGSTACIPQFRNVPELRRTKAAFQIEIGNFGWSWPTFAPGTDIEEFVAPTSPGDNPLYGKELRAALADRLSKEIRVAMELESVAVPESRVTLSPKKDALGIPRPNLNYVLSSYTMGPAKFAEDVAMQIFEAAGIENRTEIDQDGPGFFTDSEGNEFEIRGAGHIIGTYLMGSEKEKTESVVDGEQRSWDHENLFLLGSGVFPTTATANPTLTIAALSLWAGDTIVDQLNNGS